MNKKIPIRGFTLIEMIVSVGLFSVVMLVVTAAYLAIITLDKESRSTNELVVNLSFALESMARNVRTGTAYSCAGAGNGTCEQLSFIDAEGKPVTYVRKVEGVESSIGQCLSGACTSSSAVGLTDPRITIQSLTFYVWGVGTGDQTQPQVLMTVRGTMQASVSRTVDFTIQTSATQRVLDL
jgi:prepilin-type N-terminal cleavage/methylation domain-containing protein